MKKLILLTTCTILILTTSCVFEKKKDMGFTETTFEKSELLGEWIKDVSEENLKKSEVIINKINLNEDMTAKFEILDSTGNRTINGTWKIGEEHKLGSEDFNITVNPDISLIFDLNGNHSEIILLDVKEFNKEKILNFGNGYFIKKQN